MQDTSVFNLIAYRNEFLVPTLYQWIDNLKMFLNHFYIKENRTSIRKYAVAQTMKVYKQNRLVLYVRLIRFYYLILTTHRF